MDLIYEDEALKGIFRINDEINRMEDIMKHHDDLIHMLWNRSDASIQLTVDDIPVTLSAGHVMTLTYFHKVKAVDPLTGLVSFSFNREFYCIMDHDHEVSCNGIIFFGTQDLPIIKLCEADQRKVDLLFQVFIEEFKTKDNIQGEMLRMLLKRLIIMFTRLAKHQLVPNDITAGQLEIVRQYNVLVDMHFKSKKNVADYAELLFKSPKTLANLFKKYNQKTPLQIIHERIILEAKRLMSFTDKQTQEIAYDLGFDDPAHFSRFFKKAVNMSPKEFRTQLSQI